MEKITGSQNTQYIGAGVADSTRANFFNPDELPQVLTWNGPGGTVDTITAGPDERGFSYRQTLSYTGSNVTGISGWVKQ